MQGTNNDLAVKGGAFARNVVINWTALIAEVAVAFVLTPFIVRSLGLAQYGVWSLLNSLIGYIGLVDLGVRGSVGRFLNAYLARKEHQRVNEVISTSLAFLAAASLVALVAAMLIAFTFGLLFPKTPPDLLDEIRLALPLLALGLWISFWGAIYRTILTAFDRFDLMTGVGLGGLILRAGTTVFVLVKGWGLVGLVGSTVGSALVVNLIYARMARWYLPDARFRFRDVSSERLKEMWTFGLVAFTGRTAGTMAAQAAPVIAMTFVGATGVAIYAIATQLIQVGQKVVDQLGNVLSPSVMKLAGVADLPGLQSVFLWCARFGFLVGALVYLGIIVFAPAFMSLWIGPEFVAATPIVRILAIGELLAILASTAGLTLFSLGKLRASLSISVFEAVGILALSVLFAGPLGMGLLGLALGTLIPRAVARGVVYPLSAAREIKLSYVRYVGALGMRVVLVSVIAVPAFMLVERAVGVETWFQFLLAIALASAIYALVATPILLDRTQRERVLRTLLRRNPS